MRGEFFVVCLPCAFCLLLTFLFLCGIFCVWIKIFKNRWSVGIIFGDCWHCLVIFAVFNFSPSFWGQQEYC